MNLRRPELGAYTENFGITSQSLQKSVGIYYRCVSDIFSVCFQPAWKPLPSGLGTEALTQFLRGSRSRVWRLQVAVACSKIVEWVKFLLAIFQLHSSAILKFTKFLAYKRALINTPSNYICILMGDFGR